MFRIKPYLFLIPLSFSLVGCGSLKSNTEKEVEIELPPEEISQLSYQEEKKFSEIFFQAQREKAVGDIDKAQARFEAALRVDPRSDAVLFELAKIHQAKGELQRALGYLNNAVEVDPKNKWFWETKAQIHSSLGQFGKEAEIYAKLYELYPNNVEWLYQSAIAYANADQAKKAIEAMDKVEAIMGISEDISFNKQELYLSLNDISGAKKEIQNLIDNRPSEPRYYGVMAEIYATQNQPEEAIEWLNKGLEKDPDNPQVLVNLSDLYRRIGDSQKAFEMLERAFLNPDFQVESKIQILGSYYQITLRNKSLLKNADRLLEILMDLHSDVARAHVVKGDYLLRDGEVDSALTAFETAAALGETDAALFNQVLTLHLETERYEEAVEFSNQAILLYPNQPEFYLYQGVAYIGLERPRDAIKSLDNARLYLVNNKPMEAQINMFLGDAYHAIEDHERSDAAYERSLQINSDNAYLLNNYAYYLSLRNENLEKAKAMSGRSLVLMPNTPSFLDTYGWILYQLGEYDEARIKIERALEESPKGSVEMHDHLGDIYLQLGRKRDAVDQWQKALNLAGTDEKIEEKIKSNANSN